MIRGINHQVIEITETDNIYYERALLVVRPEYSSAQKTLLEREAKRMLKGMSGPSVIKPKHMFMYWALRLGAAAAFGAVLGVLVINLL